AATARRATEIRRRGISRLREGAMTEIIPAMSGPVHLTAHGGEGAGKPEKRELKTAREAGRPDNTRGAKSPKARDSQTAPGAKSLTAQKANGASWSCAVWDFAPGAVCDLRAACDLRAVCDVAPFGFGRRHQFARFRRRILAGRI